MWVLSCMRCSACISKQTLFASGRARAGSRQKELGLAAGGGEEKDHLHEKFVCSLATLATNCRGGRQCYALCRCTTEATAIFICSFRCRNTCRRSLETSPSGRCTSSKAVCLLKKKL